MIVPRDASFDVQRSIQGIIDEITRINSRIDRTGASSGLQAEVDRLKKEVTRLSVGPRTLDFNDVFRAAGPAHAFGYVPDPGSTAASRRFLREDATWANQGAISVMAYNNANITVNTGTPTVLTFNSEHWDTHGFHVTDSNTSRLTVPAGYPGWYHVTGRVRWAATTTANSFRTLRMERNSAGTATNTNIFATTRIIANADNVVFDREITGTVYLAAGDYVEIFAATGENTTVTNADLYYDTPNFSMFWVGE